MLFAFLLLLASVLAEPAVSVTVVPTTQVPLENGLTIDDLVNSRITPNVVYNSTTFDIGDDHARHIDDGQLTVHFGAIPYILHILYDYVSTVTQVPFTSDDPNSYVYNRRFLPSFTMDYTRVRRAGKTYLVPSNVNRLPNTDRFWEWQLQTAECGHKDDYDVCTFDGAYNEKNANAVYNFALIVVFDENQTIVGTPYFSTTHVQAAYYEHTFFGAVPNVTWTKLENNPNRGQAESDFNVYWTHAPPVSSIVNLPLAVRQARGIRRGTIPTFDLFNNAWNNPSRGCYESGIEYCLVRKIYSVQTLGTYFEAPVDTYIGQLPKNLQRWQIIPTYSTAKGLIDGFGYAALDYVFGATFDGKSLYELPVSGSFPGKPASWDNVTVRDLLDMQSGHYNSDKYYFWQSPQADETTAAMEANFFNVSTSSRHEYIFTFPAKPKLWVYTTLSYDVAKRVVNDALRTYKNTTFTEAYNQYVCAPLHLSKTWCGSRLTTTDAPYVEFGGFGGFGLQSDFAILSDFIQRGDGFPIMSKTRFETFFPINTREIGVPTNTAGARNPDNVTRFANERWVDGFWTNQHLDGCAFSGKYNVMTYNSGYGVVRTGHAIVPKNTVINGVKMFGWSAMDFESDYVYIDAPQYCAMSNIINPPVGYALA